jgi:dihydrofolate reductase
MKISMIVAIAENGCIGIENRLPWKQSADLQYFKKLTTGYSILMGRKTFESLGRVLPNRLHFVLSRTVPTNPPENTFWFQTIEEAILVAKKMQVEQLFVIGGAEIFKQTFPYIEYWYCTKIHGNPMGDVFLSLPETKAWKLIQSESHSADDKNEYDYTFEVYQKV